MGARQLFLQFADAHGYTRVARIQNPYNLLNLDFEYGLAEMALRENVGLIVYSPLAMGMLTGKYFHGDRPAGSRLDLFGRFFRYSNKRAQDAASHTRRCFESMASIQYMAVLRSLSAALLSPAPS
ncbi:aldo/keto reductase [Rhizobium etli]|uniref:aldo/keto reductase n=1 Tax=Rhizobium etli TaxID=29449 RepID=UPI0023EA6557|nr:aldo/keto reductase [Rhizobium etli]